MKSSAHEKIPTIPLYAFYNPLQDCLASGGIISGIEIASGVLINQIIRNMIKAKPKRLYHKRIEYLRPYFFPFSILLCSATEDGQGGAPIINPGRSRDAVTKQIEDKSTAFRLREHETLMITAGDFTEASPMPQRQLQRPSQSSSSTLTLPIVLRRAIEKREGKRITHGKVKRTKLVLISGE